MPAGASGRRTDDPDLDAALRDLLPRSPAPGDPPRSQAQGASPDAPRADEHAAPAKTRLSLTQVAASALAAISATVLMSFFGVAGTIIGAGLASVITVIGNFLYTRSIEKTHEQLKPVVTKVVARTAPAAGARSRTASIRLGDAATTTTSRGTVVSTSGATALGVDDGTADTVERTAGGTRVDETRVDGFPVDPTTVDETTANETTANETTANETTADGATGAEDQGTDEQGADEPEPRNAWLRFVEKHGTGKVLAMTAAGLFVVVMGVVLVVELVIGKPLSDAVRGQEGSGTSISRSSTDPDDATTVPTSPSEDPTNVPDDDTDQGTDGGGSTTGTTDAPTDEPTPETTGGTDPDTATDTPTDGSTGGTTDDSTDGSSTGGSTGGTGDDGSDTSDGTSGGTSGGTDDGSTGDTGTDTGSGTDPGTGTGGSDAEQGAGSSSGGSAEDDPSATATPTPAS
ncbi:hypothetical protein ACQFYA_17070 [Promicromonospora sp. Marseille-Q5078]